MYDLLKETLEEGAMIFSKKPSKKVHCGQDPVDGLEPALVVSAFDITKQKATELELQSLKAALQRRIPQCMHASWHRRSANGYMHEKT